MPINQKRRQLLEVVLIVQLSVLAVSCNLKDQPIFLEHRHPANVPADATLVDQPKGGLWERCTYDPEKRVDRCEVYNWGGDVLFNEEFIPYDGGEPVTSADLRIPRYARWQAWKPSAFRMVGYFCHGLHLIVPS